MITVSLAAGGSPVRSKRALSSRKAFSVSGGVRVDFPGALNGFAPDVAKFRAGAEKDASRRWRFQDVEFVAEVLSRNTAALDQGPKRAAYATAGVPVYLIVDPYLAKCLVCTEPKEGEYLTETRVSFGTALDLTRTPLGLTLETGEFPRD